MRCKNMRPKIFTRIARLIKIKLKQLLLVVLSKTIYGDNQRETELGEYIEQGPSWANSSLILLNFSVP